jgi:D-xylose 1-dehydrogenase
MTVVAHGLTAAFPDLAGKVVAVTGGASGIGAAIVRAFHAQGAVVAFFDIDAASGQALAGMLGEGAMFIPLDLTDIDALSASFADAAERVGAFDVLVNNAAHDERHAVADVTPAFWRDRMAVNLDHQFFAAQAVIGGMAAKGSGVIINFSSIAWRVGLTNALAYVTAKAAIEGLTRGLARELGPKGIRVNCVLPGFVRTQRQVEKWLTPELHATVMANQCLKVFIEPEDIAAIVVMLASDTARMMTNQTIVVDGGWS